MEFLSRKDMINVPIAIYQKNIKDTFIAQDNQVNVSKRIYQLHKSNGGILNYIYFRSILQARMREWISGFSFENISQVHDIYSVDHIYYLNKIFIKKCYDLYTFKAKDKLDIVPDSNVYRLSAAIGVTDDNDNIAIKNIKYNEMLASDYNQVDVWREQTTEISDGFSRYNNSIPVWQRSMNIRKYDTDNEGYAASERSSLGNVLSGYGSAFKDLQNAKEALYQKNNNFM